MSNKVNFGTVSLMIIKYDQIFNHMLQTGVYSRNISEIIEDCTNDMLTVDMIVSWDVYYKHD